MQTTARSRIPILSPRTMERNAISDRPSKTPVRSQLPASSMVRNANSDRPSKTPVRPQLPSSSMVRNVNSDRPSKTPVRSQLPASSKKSRSMISLVNEAGPSTSRAAQSQKKARSMLSLVRHQPGTSTSRSTHKQKPKEKCEVIASMYLDAMKRSEEKYAAARAKIEEKKKDLLKNKENTDPGSLLQKLFHLDAILEEMESAEKDMRNNFRLQAKIDIINFAPREVDTTEDNEELEVSLGESEMNKILAELNMTPRREDFQVILSDTLQNYKEERHKYLSN